MNHVLLIGGDLRSVEVATTLQNTDYKIDVTGFDQYKDMQEALSKLPLSDIDFTKYDAIILPVDGVGNDGSVNCPYSDSNITLTKEMIAATPKHCKIISGIATDYLRDIAAERELSLIFARDDIALYNAIPTAEATLNIAINETVDTIQGSSVAILGLGRVGFTTADLFHKVGAKVTAFMRSDEDFAKSTIMGIEAVHTNQLTEKIAEFSIVINTIPHLMLDETVLAKMKQGTLIIDLASKPGGTDFKASRKYDIKAIHALGLPGKTAPKTAGRMLGTTISKMLQK